MIMILTRETFVDPIFTRTKNYLRYRMNFVICCNGLVFTSVLFDLISKILGVLVTVIDSGSQFQIE